MEERPRWMLNHYLVLFMSSMLVKIFQGLQSPGRSSHVYHYQVKAFFAFHPHPWGLALIYHTTLLVGRLVHLLISFSTLARCICELIKMFIIL